MGSRSINSWRRPAAARASGAALPHHQRQPVGSREREPPVHRDDADAAGARAVSAGPHARADRGLRRQPSGEESEIYNPYTIVRRQGADLVGRPYHDEFKPFVTGAAAALRQAAVALARSEVRRLPADARRRAVHRRLLRERHRVARSAESEVRRHLRALRDLSRRSARREDVVRRGDPDQERGGEPQPREVSAVGARHSGCAAAAGGGSAVGARPRDADGSDGRAVPRRRSPARLPGGRRQPAQRSAHSPGEGHEEDLLQELHGRARQGNHPAAGRARDGRGAGAARVGRRVSGRRP